MTHVSRCLLLMGILAGLPLQSRAIIPVTDWGAIANLIKNYNQLKSQYLLLQHTYDNAQQQLLQTRTLVKEAEGHYGLGHFMNSEDDFNQWTWSPMTWQNTLKGLAGGNADRYHTLLRLYQQTHVYLPISAYQKGTSATQAQIYHQDTQVNRAATVTATYAFNRLNDHLQTLYALSQKIDTTPNTKAAMDLNVRVLIEMAYIQTQALKLQIVFNQQMAQAQADTLTAQTASARFNALPDS